ncbi:CTB family bacteriocin [Cronbergia sp. UHCC 0137]|uniref:CTB family bacteriocin n=1 Tax=Cronbergia sp. UHCC 0137 TaxID=3110239 RepID=UPI002B21A11A|nr:CTB family bacteriocin [Cronbergia sp. UHCC 0137]MEA5618590.1 CTB family bacteriocin [Cronbergia sp. UHCC 0137]
MSNHILTSELFVTLSNEEQAVLTGGADFELAGSNYANRLASLQGTTASGPTGSTGNSIGTTSAVNTAAQDLLGLGVPSIPAIGALGAAPILDGIGANPALGGDAFLNPVLTSPVGGLGLGSPF